MNKFAIVPFDQNGYSTKTLIDIHFLFPKVVSKVDLANKCHKSTKNVM